MGAYAPGTLATIMGYGRTSANGPSSFPDLLAADTILQSDDYMDDIFNRWYWFDDWISSLMIGAGTTYQTACFGDSGGPLVVGRNGGPVQVGVFSFLSAYDGDGCNAAGGYSELAGPQLAWIASLLPPVRDGWGGCISPSGLPGRPSASYGPYQPGAQLDGPNYWKIWCADPTLTTVPDLRGDYLNQATAKLQAAGLVLGDVRSAVDRSCEYINQVMNHSPGRGTAVAPGSVVNVTLGQRARSPCP
jgi:hypothetical protein